MLEQREEELRRALPAHIPVDRFKRIVLTTCQLNPELVTVDRQSLWIACMRAAQDGLLPDGRDGVILAYKDNNQRSRTFGQITAQWQPMVSGFLKRFRNSGQFLSITANVVRESDPFEYWIDENGEHLRHTPGDVGPYVKAYAMAKTKDGGTMIKVMSKAEIDRRRAVSKAKDGPMWREWWDEAAMKTVLRNLSKRLPSSADLDELMRRDDEDDAFEVRPATPAAAPSTGDTEASEPQTEIVELERIADPETERDSDLPGAEDVRGRDGGILNDEPAQRASADDRVGAGDVERAFAEGADARRAGSPRRAVPGPYREAEARHLARAWLNGWDNAEQRS
jgi:recombination protein RecT